LIPNNLDEVQSKARQAKKAKQAKQAKRDVTTEAILLADLQIIN
jgi:hypothetical protein